MREEKEEEDRGRRMWRRRKKKRTRKRTRKRKRKRASPMTKMKASSVMLLRRKRRSRRKRKRLRQTCLLHLRRRNLPLLELWRLRETPSKTWNAVDWKRRSVAVSDAPSTKKMRTWRRRSCEARVTKIVTPSMLPTIGY